MERNLKKEFRDLEMSVYAELRKRIENSKYISKHINQKAIQVNLFDYVELAIINNQLTFLDRYGYHSNIYAEASLEDLIDLL